MASLYFGRGLMRLPKLPFNAGPAYNVLRKCSSRSSDGNTNKTRDNKKNSLGGMSSKYQVFQEEDAEIILDIYEEKLKYSELLEEHEDTDPFEGINLHRGIQGVFDIEDLVDVLKRENAKDILVIKVPDSIQYVNYMCITTGKSPKHMQAIAQFVRRVYKHKREKFDVVPKLEGENSKDWLALDLGNIALHIFSQRARTIYDLESLWAIGCQYDEEFNKKDAISEILENHAIYLGDLEPAR